MLKLSSFVIQCENCGDYIKIDEGDLDEFEAVSHEDHGENGMGVETFWQTGCEIDCQNCGNNIKISITANEYPEGACNFVDPCIDGAEIVGELSVGGFYFSDDDIDIDIEYSYIRKLIVQISQNRDIMYNIPPMDFELVVEQVLQDNGFETTLTQSTRDGGKDIIAKKPGISGKPVVFYVECKRYAPRNKVTVHTVRELHGVREADNVNQACIVTSSSFTNDAIKFAEEQVFMIDLIDGDKLYDMIVNSAENY